MLPNNVFDTIISMFTTAWSAVYNWFVTLITATHSRNYIIGIILSMLVVRFTVYPFFKNRVISGAGSDKVMDADFKEVDE